jgi:hypothetical protein
MATITSLSQSGVLTLIDAGLDADQQPWRLLYGTEDFIRWLDTQLVTLTSSLIGNMISPIEQVDALFADFVSGEPLVISRQFRQLRPSDQAVWELKTDDIRIFGWFPLKDCFIAVYGAPADNVKDAGLYGTFRNLVAKRRDQLDLDCGYIMGGNINDVISNKD